jgi:hypothetical protein
MLYGLEAIAAMKSGPDELKRYHQQVLDEEKRMTDEATQAAAPAKPKRQRGPNKPKTATPGEVTLKITCSVSDATDLLGYMVRNQHPEIAHQLIDALAKAQKES